MIGQSTFCQLYGEKQFLRFLRTQIFSDTVAQFLKKRLRTLIFADSVKISAISQSLTH